MNEPQNISEITQTLQRDVNCLGDENRNTRKRALERLKKETIGRNPGYDPPQLQGVCGFLIKPLLRVFSDPVEKCRELSISLLADFCAQVEDMPTILPLLLPVAVARLGRLEITEPSEEIRLSLVSLLSAIVTRCGVDIGPYLNDMVLILQRTIVDPFPEVKKESCQCTSRLADAIPVAFHQQSESLSKPLFQSMTHQHSKVRLACIKALGSVIRYGTPNPLTDALPLLAQRACDSTPSVRSCLVDVVGNWLLELPDRYSYFHKLLPLLLTALTDELPEIRRKANDIWYKVGRQYEAENEEELKDKIDFVTQREPSPLLEFGRPNLGCRVLVYRNFSKILPALLKDMTDWTTNSRIKSSQLLFVLLGHLEEHTTHHIQSVLSGLYRACQDDERTVLEQATKCAEVIGCYVSPEVWCKLVPPAVRTSAGCRVSGTDQASTVPVGPVQCTSCLHVLVALMKGAKVEVIQPYLEVIVDCLSEPEVGQTEHTPLLRELLLAVGVVTEAAIVLTRDLSFKLFTVTLRAEASNQASALRGEIDRILALLTSRQGHASTQGLYQDHTHQILQQLAEGYTGWSVHSPNCTLFSALLSGAGPVLGGLLGEVLPILTSCLRPDADPEMRLHFITLLIRLLMEASSSMNSQDQFNQFASAVVTDIIIPNCVWKGGRTAAAIRTAAMTSLQALLQSNLLAREQLDSFMSQLMPKVISCLDDDNRSTRLVTSQVLQLLLLTNPPSITVNVLHTLYSDLLKRLDDSSDEIRLSITHTLIAFIRAFPEGYDSTLYRAHLEELYKGLLIHLDDPSPQIQEAIFNVLKEAARLDHPLLTQQLQEVKHKHRSSSYCELLLQFLSSSH
ncbi:dynein axonemal assembly factor 5-like [Halichondria panicea]|uniref:dynein axonemal assembly factor 5-like n=1 Tax=Halichondria panicea TaxID=6063 RepID=UPI00312BCA92